MLSGINDSVNFAGVLRVWALGEDWTLNIMIGNFVGKLDKKWPSRALGTLIACLAGVGMSGMYSLAHAEKITNDIAVFSALNKVTARISYLEVKLNDTVTFGALKITPRSCLSRPVTEKPWTSAFIEVDEEKLSGDKQRIFSGWMFAQSPGLHAVEHPVFDVWLINCKTSAGEAVVDNRKKSPRRRKALDNLWE